MRVLFIGGPTHGHEREVEDENQPCKVLEYTRGEIWDQDAEYRVVLYYPRTYAIPGVGARKVMVVAGMPETEMRERLVSYVMARWILQG